MANITEYEKGLLHKIDEKKYEINPLIWFKWDGTFYPILDEIEKIVDRDPGNPIPAVDCLMIQDKAMAAMGFIKSIVPSVGINVITADKIYLAEEIARLITNCVGNDLHVIVLSTDVSKDEPNPASVKDVVKKRINEIRKFIDLIKSKTRRT